VTSRRLLYPDLPGSRLLDSSADEVLHRFVKAWLNEFMPRLPMGLLSTSFRRWRVHAGPWHKIERLREGEDLWFVLRNEDTRELLKHGGRYCLYKGRVCPDPTAVVGPDLIFAWEHIEDATEACDVANQVYEEDRGHEHRYNTPWSGMTAYMPDERINERLLHEVGLTVASYHTPASGDYVLCGIDTPTRNVERLLMRLCFLVHDERDWTVQTEAGLVYVTMDERQPIEMLADMAIGGAT